ncbi:tripartite tricarboxylate transporter TctB family protein [Endozoicomonas sp. OPT23]|uniref:tripartite tricarboxylate transporter TctB family protein n=1 Tax=Endozoicomonas sp. OPT23 TaxID=2072845 RepID=UPI00129B4DB5|nr:tripartite tricarboxylate transporter TctB family protein [Endozoicomonas sp. OPT23]MRI32436.1 tripartite tricarboxylate transporter TctB family protein [Endozoicomonas sp. OPT23]
MDRRKIDVVLATISIVVSVIILTNDSLVEGGVETELGSLFLPRIVAGLMIVFSAAMAIPSLLGLLRQAEQTDEEAISTTGFSGVFIYIGIFITYWLVVPYVGFLVATPFVMFSIAALLGGRKWLPIVLMSVITPLMVFYGSLHFLRVFLPTWTLS